MSSLSFLLLAAIVALATGCPRDAAAGATPAPAQQIPNDGGVLNDALVRDAMVRDAPTVKLDAGPVHDGGPKGPL